MSVERLIFNHVKHTINYFNHMLIAILVVGIKLQEIVDMKTLNENSGQT